MALHLKQLALKKQQEVDNMKHMEDAINELKVKWMWALSRDAINIGPSAMWLPQTAPLHSSKQNSIHFPCQLGVGDCILLQCFWRPEFMKSRSYWWCCFLGLSFKVDQGMVTNSEVNLHVWISAQSFQYWQSARNFPIPAQLCQWGVCCNLQLGAVAEAS